MATKKEESLAAFQYRRRKEELRGHNYAYGFDALYSKLDASGYKIHQFDRYDRATSSESEAKKLVEEYRSNGNYARIICTTNKVRMRAYQVIFKHKKQKDGK